MSYHTTYAQARALLPTQSSRAGAAATLAALAIAPFLLPAFYTGEVTFIFILCIASLGLMVLTGYTGLVSLGQGAFLAIGAYVHTVVLTAGWPLAAGLLAAAAAAGAGGLVIGLPAIRVSRLHLAIVTLAFSIVAEHVLGRWKSVTGGHSGLAVPEPTLFGFSLAAPVPFYFLCLTVLVGVLALLANLLRSGTGRAFVGVRDSEAAAQALGIHVARTKVLAFVVSAATCGAAGALLAHQTQFITPESFGLALSLQLVLMVFIGGLGSLRGALLGAVLIGLLPTAISILKGWLPARMGNQFGLELMVYGGVLVLFVLQEPAGIDGRWRRLKRAALEFPLLARQGFTRQKAYMRSERA
ncbi:MAG: branched-chain amino acid ABC transporter permease [Burkholderiales bacterium]|nr:branched-chain amino acid ABC transporter permease [Burkholderiales bacterium]